MIWFALEHLCWLLVVLGIRVCGYASAGCLHGSRFGVIVQVFEGNTEYYSNS